MMAQNNGLTFSYKNEDSSNVDYKAFDSHNNVPSGANSLKSNPLTESNTNGSVESTKNHIAKTQIDHSNLTTIRTSPTSTTATGQPLTQYHSFFYSLLSWDHPRTSGIAYLLSLFLIFAIRYLNVIRYGLKVTYLILGITVLAEIIGKLFFAYGFTTQIRPRKYYTISRETLNLLIGDLHELINFFVIQAQQIIFAENLAVSIAAFISAFISYFLVKFVPLWALSILGNSALFLGTLLYKKNQELIDQNLERVVEIINQQTEQIKALVSEKAARATEQTKALVGDYSIKAQGIISSSRSPLSSPRAPAKVSKNELSEKENSFRAENFPKVPLEDFKPIKSFESQANSIREDQNLIST